MPSIFPDILFYAFSALSLAGAGMVLVRRNPMHCAAALVVSVLSVAVLYLLLSAHFIAAAQMVVYAGAIVVLFVFVIMLLNLTEEELGRFRFSLFKLFGVFVAVATLLAVLPGPHIAGPETPGKAVDAERYGSVPEVGRLLFGEYVLAFELTSVLILAAMVSGVVLAKKDMTPKKVYSLIDWIIGKVSK